MSSLREALSAALDAQDTTTDAPAEAAAPVEAPATFDATTGADVTAETPEAKASRERDERGRFAAKQAEAAQAPAAKAPPSSWKKDYWDHWGKLDPQIQDYIDQREQEAARGVSSYKQQYDQAAPFYQAVQPFIPHLQQRGVAPERWLADLGNVDRILSTGSMEQKAQLIARMAAANGVDLQGLAGGQANPQFGHIAQTVNTLQQRLQQFETQQQEAELRTLQQTINSFGGDKPHFQAVRATMGQLLQSGVVDASSGDLSEALQTAYDKAIRLHDDIWQQEQASQASAVNRQAELLKKKAAASSPKSASPTGNQAAGNGKKSLRETLSESFESAVSGRV
jgi:hypothetical protein